MVNNMKKIVPVSEKVMSFFTYKKWKKFLKSTFDKDAPFHMTRGQGPCPLSSLGYKSPEHILMPSTW